jgi:RNA polymerase sigma-32 factor
MPDVPSTVSETESEILPAETAAPALPAVPSADKSVGPVDALSAYMSQLGQHPPISREEEHELAVRWVEEGDAEAARTLVLSNLRLVVKIAMEYRRAWTNVLDLIQDGNVGLLEAVQRYDPYQAQRKLFFRLNKEKRSLERQGFEIEPKLIAERLEVSEEDVVSMDRTLSASDQSLNAPLRRDADDGAEYGDFLTREGQEDAEHSVADSELQRVFMQHVDAFTETLDERDRKLVHERILAEEPKTLAELGEELGVSRERVRQLEARIITRLRDYMKENLVDFEFYAAPEDE